jgi:hypothetical protein
MNTIDAVYKRRAVKQFDNTHTLSESEERKLLEATIQAIRSCAPEYARNSAMTRHK